MSKEKIPVTAAVRELRAGEVEFTDHLYKYEEKGGTSPFGTRKKMPVYMEETILELPKIYINAEGQVTRNYGTFAARSTRP